MRLRYLVAIGFLAASCRARRATDLEILPEHFLLQPGEQIHYTVVEHLEGGKTLQPDGAFTIEDPSIVRLITPAGLLEAVRAGRTAVLVRAGASQRRVVIEVAGGAQPPMAAVPYDSVSRIAAKELLFVGHANRDGFDHTAVAKPGIDRLVQDARKNGRPVVYWVSQEYPDWYTADRHPDYAIITEGQEHRTRVDAERVTFAGGSFMFCLLRNVQMTLHGMLKEAGERRIDFVFPADGIWVEDMWGPGDKRPYPAPMVLLTTLFGRRSGDEQAYREVVVPFLDRVIDQYPVAGYPAVAPTPPLRDLMKDWSIVVRFSSRFQRVYRRGDSNKTWLLEFQDV
jgi:hypothetical protein